MNLVMPSTLSKLIQSTKNISIFMTNITFILLVKRDTKPCYGEDITPSVVPCLVWLFCCNFIRKIFSNCATQAMANYSSQVIPTDLPTTVGKFSRYFLFHRLTTKLSHCLQLYGCRQRFVFINSCGWEYRHFTGSPPL